ncbi:MAG TPA: S41 family peptidase [Gemmatimonadales bacterium]|nr:S41 family peptidase [Gemmatimonadales bacterium]
MRHRWAITAAIAVISFFSGGWLLQRGTGDDTGVFRNARVFDDVMNHVRHFYVDSIPEADLYKKATDGMLAQLKDPYSVLLVEDDFRDLTEKTSGNYAGLGIQIDVRDGWITVVAPLPDTPAERAGIETGDQIIEVDGKSTHDWNSEQAVKALRGAAGSKVKIVVRRAGFADPMPYELARATIHIKSVPTGTMFDGGVGYISLNPVSETSAQELRDEIVAMKAKGMKAMVLDLRNNPGGLLDQGVKVADIFLDPGQQIVSTRGRSRGSTREFLDDAKQLDPQLPIVVLVSEGSASAAEIIAGALQDHDRALVVGTPTFGKGLVQTLYPLGESTALKLTTARWFTPSGRTIQREAKDEVDQLRQVMADSDPRAAGRDTVPDTSLANRPKFKTDAGRTVRGGGGIVPDVIVRADTFTTVERAFITAVGEKAAAYRDVLTSYALELKQQKAITAESFTVTPAMREALYQRLAKKGITMPSETYTGAAPFVDQQLGYEVSRYVFGRPSEFRRRAQDDPQMQAALRMLRKASTPKDLLTLATGPATQSTKAN